MSAASRTVRKNRRRALGGVLAAAAVTLMVFPPASQAADLPVQVYLTTTSDPGGRDVVKGLEAQQPIAFTPGEGGDITVDETKTYQEFEGAGASFTDTAAWLMNSSGALDDATRQETMRKLFSPTDGIGVGFLRNPMGASDLARENYNYDDTCCDLTDFSLDHDKADVLPLTKQARELNPDLKVKLVPWSAPGWMKDNNNMNDQGWLKAEYYRTYADYFTKTVQGYQDFGVPVDYVSPQNEPTCCGEGTSYPSMNWNDSGLAEFAKNNLWPAFREAGIGAKTMVLDYNWSDYDKLGAGQLADPQITGDPLFGGIAWHGYGGDVSKQSEIHDQYPQVNAYDTEHSGGTWVENQQKEDMHNLIDYTRNWGRSWVKWSLAVDQNGGPHNGGCGTCTGLVTVHNGDDQHGKVDYTVEYYTMGHLTKFVKPGAQRIDSTQSSSVPNVAWKNPDGSKALIAYNETDTEQPVKVNWNGQTFDYRLPAGASATFTWDGRQNAPGGHNSNPDAAAITHRQNGK